jgi:hypothetical protein
MHACRPSEVARPREVIRTGIALEIRAGRNTRSTSGNIWNEPLLIFAFTARNHDISPGFNDRIAEIKVIPNIEQDILRCHRELGCNRVECIPRSPFVPDSIGWRDLEHLTNRKLMRVVAQNVIVGPQNRLGCDIKLLRNAKHRIAFLHGIFDCCGA